MLRETHRKGPRKMVTAFTAIDTTRSLTKGQGYLRGKLHSASKHEESTGNSDERLMLTAKLDRDIKAAERAISDTRAASIRYQKAADILRGGVSTKLQDILHQQCADLVRMGGDCASLCDQMQRIADRARDAAEHAADRLAKHDLDLQCTAALAAYLARLADAGFKSNKSIERDRQTYLALKRVSQ